jgi:hypothetical protein
MNRSLFAFLSAAVISAVPATAQAQNPSNTQAQVALSNAATHARVLAEVRASGMSPDQIRTQLKGLGYRLEH